MPNLFFPDLSQSYQPRTTWPALRKATSVVVVEVSWGTKITASPAFIAAARAQAFACIVWYMGLTTKGTVADQVATFWKAVGELGPTEGVFIDWETTPGEGVPSLSMLSIALAQLANVTGRPPATIGRYEDEAMLPESSGLPGWAAVAEYGGTEPKGSHLWWQFTDGSGAAKPAATYPPIDWPGVGSIDSNVFHGTPAQLMAVVLPSRPETKEETEMWMSDPATGKILATTPDGELYAEAEIPAPFAVATLEQHPTWHAGTAESGGANPVVGLVPWLGPDGLWGRAFVTKPTSGAGGFGPYDLYHFGRDGTPH